MKGLRLFRHSLRRAPGRALMRLVWDYLLYAGMVLYCLAIWLLAKPLAWGERLSGRPLRKTLLRWIGKMAHA